MEGYFAEKVAKNSITKLTSSNNNNNNKSEQIDLTLKLSLCWQNAEEEEEEEKWLTRSSSMANGTNEGSFVASSSWQESGGGGVMRFGELQTMRRVRTGKRLLLEKQRRNRAAAAAAAVEAVAPPPAGGEPSSLVHAIEKFNLHVDSFLDDEAPSPMQENESMISPKAMIEEMHTKVENPAKKLKSMNPNCVKGDDSMDILRQMPNVTTTGDGPNGKRIEGLLYNYREGQVCIVCVCHGRFLSPAEFVMHSGGKEVVNPMKHITVCSNSF